MEDRPEGLPEGLDVQFVFSRVRSILPERERALWVKVESEIKNGNVDSANSFLRVRFSELKSVLTQRLTEFKENLE